MAQSELLKVRAYSCHDFGSALVGMVALASLTR